jgi:nucleotide-binding universal stress UspA family protein
MTPAQIILVPIDFSTSAEHALDYAVTLAAKLDAKIHLLHVIAIPAYGSEYGITVTQSTVEDAVRNAQGVLDRMVEVRAGDASFGPCEVEFGDARGVINETAAKLDADLIVMGTHGRQGVRRLILGSVAEAVARTSDCPVLLIREGSAK